MRDLIGRTFGHYRIVEKIGEGGIGEMHQVKDTSMPFEANSGGRT
jgi:hypothetical protein